MNKDRTKLRALILNIEPLDAHERTVIKDMVQWIESDAVLYRILKPNIPDRHLVSYFVLVDAHSEKLLLMDHIKAGLWLPSGGHVEPQEDPRATVTRELEEELGLEAARACIPAQVPLFVTTTRTRGQGGHIDVSLWYVVTARHGMVLDPDPREFRGHKWLSFDEILQMDPALLDPEMHRFTRKLQASLGSYSAV